VCIAYNITWQTNQNNYNLSYVNEMLSYNVNGIQQDMAKQYK